MMADTRPSMALGVTAWRSVVVAMVHRMGPAPNRKNAAPASRPEGQARVPSMSAAAASAASGPAAITPPKGRRRARRGAASAPATMPAP